MNSAVPLAVSNSDELSSQKPWPGLRAFTESDSEFFFGREREAVELLSIIKRAAVMVLYGRSGLGKTSLLQAGLFPKLKRLDFLPLRLRFDHDAAAPPLAEQIKIRLASEMKSAGVKAPFPSEQETLWEYFHRRDADFWAAHNRLLTPVIVLDQFEEIFTLGQKSERTIARVAQFLSDLESIIEHRPPQLVRERLEADPDDTLNYDLQRQSVKFVLSLREDFLPQLDPLRKRMPSLLPHRFRLERMTGSQALEVVERAGRALVDPTVARDIVEFVSASKRKRESRSMEERDVEPALLSVVCDELNRRRIKRYRNRITADLLTEEQIGIIQGFYERAFDGVSSRVRDWVENELLTASGYRDRAALEDAIKAGLPESAFELLVDRRLLHREEREGVVWLELTHDLLSDPAAQSRVAREQRLEAEAVAKREAELAEKLRRTRRLSAVFAILLLASLTALGGALLEWHRARVQTKVADDATQKAKIAADTAKQALSKVESTFGIAVTTADSLGLVLMGHVRSDMHVPTATLRHVIDTADESYKRFRDKRVAGEIALRQARLHAAAADALQERGYFEEGRRHAEDALGLLKGLEEPTSGDSLHLTQAQALTARGKCLLATGDFEGARQDFNQALSLVSPAAKADEQQDMGRAFVSAKIGLGEVEVQAFEFRKASEHFEQVLQLIKTIKVGSEDSTLWKTLALKGIGLSQTDDTQAAHRLDEAYKTLGVSSPLQEPNLRRKRLFAEIAYHRGFIAYRLEKLDEAEQFFTKSNDASEDLYKRDSDNLDWRLSLVQGQRGLGMVHLKRGEWELSQEALERAEKGAKELNDAQPSWIQAKFLRGAVIFSLGDLIHWKYWDSHPDWRDRKDFERALERFTEARRLLHESAQVVPKNLGLLALAIAYQGLMYESQASDRELSLHAREEKNNKALERYAEARKTLQPIEKMEEMEERIATFHSWTGRTLLARKQSVAAINSYNMAVRILADVVKRSPTPENYYALSTAHTSLGNAYMETQEPSKASSEYAFAADAISRALAVRPEEITLLQQTRFLRQKAEVQAATFDMRISQGDLPRAVEALDKAITTIWSALQDDYSDKTLNEDLSRYRAAAQKKMEQQIKAAMSADQAVAGLKPGRLTAQQSEVLLRKIDGLLAKSAPTKLLERNAQAGWVLQPLVPGAWRMLGSTELEATRKQLLDADKHFSPDQILGIRKLPVDFYDDAALYEAEIVQKSGEHGVISYMQRGTKTVFLDGWPDRIHTMNKESAPRLDTVERATAYLRFFWGAIQTEDGRLMLVEQVEDMHWLPDAKAERRNATAGKIKPLIVQATPGGGWQGIGTIQHSKSLYDAVFHLSRVGYVELSQNKAVASDLPVIAEGFLHGIRGPYTEEMGMERLREKLAANPNDKNALKDLPGFYARLNRWKEAAEAEDKWAASLRRTNDPEQRKELTSAFQELSWYQLMAGEFASALASAEAGKRLDDSSPVLNEDRAHALLFLGRTEEAKDLYRQLEATPKGAETVLEDLVTLSSQLKRWKQAVEGEQGLVALLQHEEEDNQQRREKLVGEYTNLSWYQLMARDFAGALASCETGLRLDESSLNLETNHAHALVFLGRTQEAESLYLRYRGKKISANSDKTWEQVILKDFDDLEKEGLSSPEMTRIRSLLKSQSG